MLSPVVTYHIDCENPVDDGIMNAGDLETFLREHIKVKGKVNNLRRNVSVERNKHKITVHSTIPYSKRYLKYLTKKFLKKANLRDFLRVVAPNDAKDTYVLRYFSIYLNDDDSEEEENE